MRRLIPTCGLILACATAGAAEEIRVLTAGSLQRALARIAESYKTDTGHDITIEVGTTPVMRERLAAGETFDILIGTSALLEFASEQGQAPSDVSRAPEVGRIGVGVAVRGAVDVGPVQTPEQLEALLLSADTVVYNRGSSGVYAQSMIASLGIAGRIADRTTQYANGGQVMDHVIEGSGRDLGLAPLTEIRANAPNGIVTIPLPDAVQNFTRYSAVVTPGAVEPAADFVRYLTTSIARDALIATGVD